MPGKYKTHHHEYDSGSDFEAADTLIGRNRVPPAPVKKARPQSAKKKTIKRPVTPGSARKKRPRSAPAARSGRELWLNAVKNRQTIGLAHSRRQESPRHKTASEYWIDTLRKTGHGISTESTGMNTFRGKHPNDKAMPYLSTSSYMRQLMGAEKGGKASDPTARMAPGTPAYKSQEEYYEQILEYKKQATAMNQESAALKAKIRRLEEDNLKKEKEIAGLLDPQKSEELRRTLTDKKPDSGAVIHSLKQKILKLETQMRDKESSYVKLQGDLKTTKVDEMKQQMEVFYQEIVRLQNSKESGMDKTSRSLGRDGTVKVKALNETILRLNKTNEQLQAENRALKEDLRNALDEGKERVSSRDYEDMNRKQLLKTIVQLEKKLDRTERRMDAGSVISYESKATDVPGKIALDGSLEDRLEQLDRRESELLEEVEKNRHSIKQLRDEKARYKRRCEELEKLLKGSRIDYDHVSTVQETRSEARSRRSPSGSRPSSSGRPMSGRAGSERPLSGRSESDRPLSGRSARDHHRPGSGRPGSAKRKQSLESGVSGVRKEKIKTFQENHAAKNIQKQWRSHQQEKQMHNRKVEQFKENRAARKIQHGWTDYKHRRYTVERDEASDLIRSALLGHTNRQRQMQRYRDIDDETDDYETENEEYNQCVDLIQSAIKGHNSRKSRMKNLHLDSTGEDEDEDDDDDIMLSPKRSMVSSHRPIRPVSPDYKSRPQSGKSRSSISSSSKASVSSFPRSTTTYTRPAAHSSNMYSLGEDDDF